MPITFHTLTKQRGAATLVISLILLLAITLMTFSGVRVGVTEQRISANDVRSKQVMAVAEASIENAIGYLSANDPHINKTTANGWLLTGAPRWVACTVTTALPCGNGTKNIYDTGWLRYTLPTNQLTSISTDYTAQIHFLTPSLAPAAPVVSDYPLIHIIADVTPSAAGDPLGGKAQVKQIVQGYSLFHLSPNSAMAAQGAVGLSGSFKLWGNPTGQHTKQISSVTAASTPAADYIIAYNNNPAALSAFSNWTKNETTTAVVSDDFSVLRDDHEGTFIKTSTNAATFNATVNRTAAYTTAIPSITIGVRAKTAGNEQLKWGPVIGSTPYFSPAVTLTTTWKDYNYSWDTNPATGAAWTVTDIGALVAQIQAVADGAMSEVQVSEVWVDGYRVRYTISTLTGKKTVVEKGLPLTVRSRNAAVNNSGSSKTCNNWANINSPPSEIAPYTYWYPAVTNNNPDCTVLSTDSSSADIKIRSDVISFDTSIPADTFQYIFGKAKEKYQEVKANATILTNCDSLTTSSNGLYWITGNCNIQQNDIGTYEKPVIIIMEGNLSMNASPLVYGLLYLFTQPSATSSTVSVTLNGNPLVVGSLVSDQQINLGSGSFTAVFNRSVLENGGGTAGSFAKLPGGWLDQL